MLVTLHTFTLSDTFSFQSEISEDQIMLTRNVSRFLLLLLLTHEYTIFSDMNTLHNIQCHEYSISQVCVHVTLKV